MNQSEGTGRDGHEQVLHQAASDKHDRIHVWYERTVGRGRTTSGEGTPHSGLPSVLSQMPAGLSRNRRRSVRSVVAARNREGQQAFANAILRSVGRALERR